MTSRTPPDQAADPSATEIVFIPPLVALLVRAEQLRGRELSEEEVLRVRDGATAVVVPLGTGAAMAAARGYADLDPDAVWEDWRRFRDEG